LRLTQKLVKRGRYAKISFHHMVLKHHIVPLWYHRVISVVAGWHLVCLFTCTTLIVRPPCSTDWRPVRFRLLFLPYRPFHTTHTPLTACSAQYSHPRIRMFPCYFPCGPFRDSKRYSSPFIFISYTARSISPSSPKGKPFRENQTTYDSGRSTRYRPAYLP